MTNATAATPSSASSGQTGLRFVGAGVAGALELALFHPVDTVAKRLMASNKRLSYQNYAEVIFQESSRPKEVSVAAGAAAVGDGGVGVAPVRFSFDLARSRVRGLFPGLGYGALYKISQRSYKFGGQPFVKDLVRKPYERAFGSSDSSGKKANDAVRRALFCDGVAGAIMGAGEVVLLPFDVLKIKAQTNPTYRGRNFLAVFKQEGLRNLYAGWQWTMMRNVPGSFALFGVNAAVREKVFRQQQPPTFLQTAATSTCGSLASILVACPCDVVKTRIQSGRFDGEGRNGFAIARDIVREEGVQGFFKGALPKCGAVGPKLIFSFTVAQYLMQRLAGGTA